MDNCRMNYAASRSCKIQPRNVRFQTPRRTQSSSCDNCSDKIEDASLYTHADELPLAMAYVPFQKFSNTFNLSRAIEQGTIFPDLCKPFCGKRGMCR